MSVGLSVITFDGTSGVGKGTISKIVAKRLGWKFLDSGALYRVLALAAIKHAIPLNNEKSLGILAKHLDVVFKSAEINGMLENVIELEGRDVTLEIRSEQCSDAASIISAFPQVREALLERQRDFLESPGLVTDGRDMGTIVFPQAQLKFFLDADLNVRANRRYAQLKSIGIDANIEHILADMAKRDERDLTRDHRPLYAAKDAIMLNTSELSKEEVLALVLEKIEEIFGFELLQS